MTRCEPYLSVSLPTLRSAGCWGIGDIGCLRFLVDIASALNLDKVVLNDTIDYAAGICGSEASAADQPIYPAFIDLNPLGPLLNRAKETEYKACAEELEPLTAVDFIRVYNIKMHFLHEKFLQNGAETLSSDGYHAFWRANRSWLERYSAFCTLRHKYGTGNSRYWSEPDFKRLLTDADFIKEYSGDLRFHCYAQYLIHSQIADALQYAAEKGVDISLAPYNEDNAGQKLLRDWWAKLDPSERNDCYRNVLGLDGEAPEELESWIAEEIICKKLRDASGPVALPLPDLICITALDPDTNNSRMSLSLESILQHRALLGQIGNIIDKSIKQ